jgi:GNAT superfamily N-acetyltransferase
MIRPLKTTDYRKTKWLFNDVFDESEDGNFAAAWRRRDPEASLGLWIADRLVAAAVVCAASPPSATLEFIFVDERCRGSGYGSQLLAAVLAVRPALHLTPVNDESLIRWYESQGFRLSSCKGERKIYVRHTYNLRSRETDAVLQT